MGVSPQHTYCLLLYHYAVYTVLYLLLIIVSLCSVYSIIPIAHYCITVSVYSIIPIAYYCITVRCTQYYTYCLLLYHCTVYSTVYTVLYILLTIVSLYFTVYTVLYVPIAYYCITEQCTRTVYTVLYCSGCESRVIVINSRAYMYINPGTVSVNLPMLTCKKCAS